MKSNSAPVRIILLLTGLLSLNLTLAEDALLQARVLRSTSGTYVNEEGHSTSSKPLKKDEVYLVLSENRIFFLLKDPEGRKFKVASSEVETSPIIEDAQPKKRSRRELTKSERTSMLYLIRDQRLIKSIRKNEDISDEELLDLHTKALEAKRYQDMMRALRSYQKDN